MVISSLGEKKIPFFVSVSISQKLTGLIPACGFCCIIILTIIVCLCSHSLSIKRLLMWPRAWYLWLVYLYVVVYFLFSLSGGEDNLEKLAELERLLAQAQTEKVKLVEEQVCLFSFCDLRNFFKSYFCFLYHKSLISFPLFFLPGIPLNQECSTTTIDYV